MAEEDTKKNNPSLPPNYVSIAQLQEQWLKRKQKQKEGEEAKQKQIERETEQPKQGVAAQKQIRQLQQHQRQENYVLNSGNIEKSRIGRFRGSNRPWYKQKRSYNQNRDKGGYDNKGKGKIGEVGETQGHSFLHRTEESGDFERCDCKLRRNDGGDGVGFEVVMVAGVEDEIMGLKKRYDGFRGGLTRNVGGLFGNNDVSEILGEGETIVETKEGLNRGKKVDVGARRVGPKKNGLLRPSRVNKGALLVNSGDSDNLGRREDVEKTEEVLEGKEYPRINDMGAVVEVRNMEQRRRGGYQKNWNKKGIPRGEFGRCTEQTQGQGNGRCMGEENGIQLDSEKKNGERNGEERNGDNIVDGEDVAVMGVAIEVRNVEQRSRGRYKNKQNKKGLSRSEFERGTEQGQGNGSGMGDENGIQLDLKKKNGEKNEEERNGDNTGDGEDVAAKVTGLKEWKHNRVSVGRRNVNGSMMDKTRWGYEKYAVKGAREGGKIIKNTVGEKSSTDESVEEIPVVAGEINHRTDLSCNGSQTNDFDNMANGEVQVRDNTKEKKEDHKFGEHEDKGLLMTNEANGERASFRYKTRGNWNEGFSGVKIRRDFKELSLDIQRVGNGRKNIQMYGQKRWFRKDPRFGDNQRKSCLVWVKKGTTADVSEFGDSQRNSDLLFVKKGDTADAEVSET